MEFKCKKCGSTKYRQINTYIKQCTFCGLEILDEGTKSQDLDWTSEIIENEDKPYARFKFNKEINYNMSYRELLKAMEAFVAFPIENIRNE